MFAAVEPNGNWTPLYQRTLRHFMRGQSHSNPECAPRFAPSLQALPLVKHCPSSGPRVTSLERHPRAGTREPEAVWWDAQCVPCLAVFRVPADGSPCGRPS